MALALISSTAAIAQGGLDLKSVSSLDASRQTVIRNAPQDSVSMPASLQNMPAGVAGPISGIQGNGGGGRGFAGQTDFQKFIATATGKSLPIFGHRLFQGAPSTFAPVDNVPVTPDYVIGPGDELLIRAWGQIDVDYKATVDRTGAIFLPKVGSIRVAGLPYQDLQGYLKTAVGRVFRNFDLNVNLGQLRSIQVFVVGQARSPGSYTVSSLSTLVNTLFAAGGPSATGSMRNIQLKRGNKVVTEFDFYDLLLKGDKSKDAQLLPGDVIFIPSVGPLAAVTGSVNSPAVFELKAGNTLNDLLTWAGGLSSTAKGGKVTVERTSERTLRTVDEFTLDDAGLARSLRDGDLVNVFAIQQRFDNAVTLRGNVAQPMRFPWREGMRIKDIVPDRETLITPDYWLSKNADIRQNDLDQARLRTEVKRTLAEINWDYAVVERLNWQDLTTTLIPFNLGKVVMDGDDSQNLLLQAGDTVTVFSKDDIRVPVSRQTQYVMLEGELARPGVYRIEPGESLRSLVARVGGVTPNAYLFGAEFTRLSTQKQQQEKLAEIADRMQKEFEQSAQERLRSALTPEEVAGIKAETEGRRIQLAKLRDMKAKGRIVLEVPMDGARAQDLPDVPLEDGDRLLVPSLPSSVTVHGAVFNENAFLFKPEKRVGDYLSQAGGTTRFADDSSTFVIRADGSVVSKRESGWLFGSLNSVRPKPGDAIVVPEETERTTWVKSLKDWTQILYQFGLGAAALKTIR
jgi:protein involved in polysaccharide export with SLBB domain